MKLRFCYRYIYFCAALFFIFCIISALSACKQNDDIDLGSTSNLNLIKNGTLTVGISPGFAPFESYIDGEIQGIDVDISELIAKDMKLKLEFKTIRYEELLDAVINNEVDIGISAINITPEREKFVAFSSPYYSDEKVLVANSNFSITDDNLEQLLQNNSKKIGCIKTSTCEEYVDSHYNNLLKKTFNNNKELLLALKNNQCDFAVVYKSALDIYSDYNVNVVRKINEKDECAIAINKADVNLYQMVNKDISIRNSDGTIPKIINKWLYSNE